MKTKLELFSGNLTRHTPPSTIAQNLRPFTLWVVAVVWLAVPLELSYEWQLVFIVWFLTSGPSIN